MTEEHEDMIEKMQQMGQEFNKYKKFFRTHFKDMEVEIRDWSFGVSKEGKEYLVNFGCKVAVKPKAKAQEAKAAEPKV
ncbi:MAG: hypothetical protein ACE14S_10910 [Candidatus Bathyarchaeia archaeon]